MVDAYINYWKKYVDFKSRSSRSDFWWVVLVNSIISLFTLTFGFVGIFIGMDLGFDNNPHITHMFAFVIGIMLFLAYFLYHLATIIPNIMIGIRRIRDTGLSPWWYALKIVTITGTSTYYYSEFIANGLMPMDGGTIISNDLGAIAGLVLFIMYLLPTNAATEKIDAPTETVADSDENSDEKPLIEPASSQIDPNSNKNAED